MAFSRALTGLFIFFAQSTAVIPPGQESLIADMLGVHTALPGPCRFTGASVDHNRVVGRYVCDPDARAVTIELRHRSDASIFATHTSQFALVETSGNAPSE